MLDIEAEQATAPLSVEEIARLQAMKTGALLKFSVEAGTRLAGAGATARAALATYGARDRRGVSDRRRHSRRRKRRGDARQARRQGRRAEQGDAGRSLGLEGAAPARRLVDEAIVGVAEAGVGAAGDILRATARFVAARAN